LKEDIIRGTLITGNVHIDFIPLGIFGFVYDFISFVMFCFGFSFAMGFFPNAVVGPLGVLVMYLKSYQGFNKKKQTKCSRTARVLARFRSFRKCGGDLAWDSGGGSN